MSSSAGEEVKRTCTWVGCTERALHPQHGKDGSQWADLCSKHVHELDAAIEDGPPRMLSAWVKAQGGAKKAAARMR